MKENVLMTQDSDPMTFGDEILSEHKSLCNLNIFKIIATFHFSFAKRN